MARGSVGLYRIRAKLATPMVWHRGLNLDALAVSTLCDVDADIPTRRSASTPEPPRIPISYLRHNGERVYLSSDAMLPRDARFAKTHWVRRRDDQDIHRMTRKINRAGGVDRDKMVRGRLALATHVGWQFWSMNPNWLYRLMESRVDALGGLRAHGYGRVAGWEISRVEDGKPAMAWIYEGLTLRALPVDWLADGMDATWLPVRPPYWHQSSLVMAAPAGSPVRQGLTPYVERKLESSIFLERGKKRAKVKPEPEQEAFWDWVGEDAF